jgi:hypothetical protein
VRLDADVEILAESLGCLLLLAVVAEREYAGTATKCLLWTRLGGLLKAVSRLMLTLGI